jgi:hypothetical protein
MLMPSLVTMPGLVTMSDLHDIQDARIIRLQHVNNSHPGATANHAQPGQSGPSASPAEPRRPDGLNAGVRTSDQVQAPIR